MSALSLLTVLVEYETTRDAHIDEANGGWTCRPCAPPGDGWRISDASHDYRTRWRRVRLVDASDALRIEQEGRRR